MLVVCASVLRVVERHRNGVVLVGHGYGGSIISQVGVHNRVKGLVYVSAIAPDVGESAGKLFSSLPNSGYATLMAADAHG